MREPSIQLYSPRMLVEFIPNEVNQVKYYVDEFCDDDIFYICCSPKNIESIKNKIQNNYNIFNMKGEIKMAKKAAKTKTKKSTPKKK
jgi:hypothetical protein